MGTRFTKRAHIEFCQTEGKSNVVSSEDVSFATVKDVDYLPMVTPVSSVNHSGIHLDLVEFIKNSAGSRQSSSKTVISVHQRPGERRLDFVRLGDKMLAAKVDSG